MGCIFGKKRYCPWFSRNISQACPDQLAPDIISFDFITTRRLISESSVAWPRETEPNMIDLHDLVIVFQKCNRKRSGSFRDSNIGTVYISSHSISSPGRDS